MSDSILVVGGGSGIGRAVAERVAGVGDAVVVADIRRPEVGLPYDIPFIEVDARDPEAVETAVAAAERSVGPLAGVVYAAGTARVTPLLDITRKEWDLILAVNAYGALATLQASARRFRARGGGSFVAVSSIDGARPVAGLAHYGASKAALESLVRVAALELAEHRIRVNAVAPGVIRTPLMAAALNRPEVRDSFMAQIPLGRIGDPADIAAAVAFLLSNEASYLTGQTLVVDGGMSLREHPRLLEGDTS